MAKAGDPWWKAPGRHAEAPRIARRRVDGGARGRRFGQSVRDAAAAPGPRTGVRMKRGNQFTDMARAAGTTKAASSRLDDVVDADAAADRDGSALLRQAVRETEPLGAFDARAIKELQRAAPTDPKQLRRTIRRTELRQIVPLADSTIYELERRGEFPQRFYLTARCVVWDLAEVMAWLQSRRQAGSNGSKKAPMPDVRKRMHRPISVKG